MIPQDRVRQFIIQEFMHGKGELKDDRPLFKSGIVDSLGFITLLAWLEKTFEISFEQKELNLEELNSVNAIAGLIKKKKEHQSGL